MKKKRSIDDAEPLDRRVGKSMIDRVVVVAVVVFSIQGSQNVF